MEAGFQRTDPVPPRIDRNLLKPAARYGHRIPGIFRQAPAGTGKFSTGFRRKIQEYCFRKHCLEFLLNRRIPAEIRIVDRHSEP